MAEDEADALEDALGDGAFAAGVRFGRLGADAGAEEDRGDQEEGG